jgi:hypothetical protein
MQRVDWTYELPVAGSSPEGLEEYEVRTAAGEHVGSVAGVVRHADEILIVVDAGAMPPLVHKRLAIRPRDVEQIDHAALVVWLACDRAGLDQAAFALSPAQALHRPGAEAGRVTDMPGGMPSPAAPGTVGQLAGPAFVAASFAAALTVFVLFAIVAVWMARGFSGWEYAVLLIPPLLASGMLAIAGYAVYREPHLGHTEAPGASPQHPSARLAVPRHRHS